MSADGGPRAQSESARHSYRHGTHMDETRARMRAEPARERSPVALVRPESFYLVVLLLIQPSRGCVAARLLIAAPSKSENDAVDQPPARMIGAPISMMVRSSLLRGIVGDADNPASLTRLSSKPSRCYARFDRGRGSVAIGAGRHAEAVVDESVETARARAA
jgi:hypothetical protein